MTRDDPTTDPIIAIDEATRAAAEEWRARVDHHLANSALYRDIGLARAEGFANGDYEEPE